MGRKKLFAKDEVLSAIHALILRNGLAPTIGELREELGVGSTRTILRYLRSLEEDGAIRRWPGARGIELARAPEGTNTTRAVPLVGSVSAGPLMLAEENIEMWVRLPYKLTQPRNAKFFLLRVRGDSMNRARVDGARLEDGDLVLIEQRSTAPSGAIVVAYFDGEATIKRLIKGKGYWILQPESTSPGHEPIIVDRDLRTQGIARRVLKQGSHLLNLA